MVALARNHPCKEKRVVFHVVCRSKSYFVIVKASSMCFDYLDNLTLILHGFNLSQPGRTPIPSLPPMRITIKMKDVQPVGRAAGKGFGSVDTDPLAQLQGTLQLSSKTFILIVEYIFFSELYEPILNS